MPEPTITHRYDHERLGCARTPGPIWRNRYGHPRVLKPQVGVAQLALSSTKHEARTRSIVEGIEHTGPVGTSIEALPSPGKSCFPSAVDLRDSTSPSYPNLRISRRQANSNPSGLELPLPMYITEHVETAARQKRTRLDERCAVNHCMVDHAPGGRR